MLDTHVGLKKGEAFRNLPKSVVIFLCADDILERGKAFYDITRKTEDNTPFNDGSRIIILNCSFKGKHKLSKLIDDFNSTSEEGMNYKELSELVGEKKQRLRSEGPMKTFDRGYEYGVLDGLEKGLEQGLQSSRIDTAKKMLSMGKFSYDDIAESTSLPIEKIKELAG